MRNKQIASISLTVFAVAMYLCTVPAVKAQVSVTADVSACSSLPGITLRHVTYYENLNPSSTDLRAGVVGDRFIIRMQGWLYFEAGKKQKNEKVIIYNHGHNDTRTEPCALVKYFVDKGFVVFAPLRRGHSAATPSTIPIGWHKISSTGVHTDDYVSNCLISGNAAATRTVTRFRTVVAAAGMKSIISARRRGGHVQLSYMKPASINADGTRRKACQPVDRP
jgi:hypothetical protein